MKLFKNKEPQTIEVKGHPLVCPVCSNNLFYSRNTFIHRGVFARDWANCFVCSSVLIFFGFGVK